MISQLLKLVDVSWPDITQYLQILVDAPATISAELRYSVNYLISKVLNKSCCFDS